MTVLTPQHLKKMVSLREKERAVSECGSSNRQSLFAITSAGTSSLDEKMVLVELIVYLPHRPQHVSKPYRHNTVSFHIALSNTGGHEQSHIIAHSQRLTNGLSDRDYRVLTIYLFYVQK